MSSIEHMDFPDVVEVDDDTDTPTTAGPTSVDPGTGWHVGTPLLSADDVERANAQIERETFEAVYSPTQSPRRQREQAEREKAAQQAEQARAERIAAGGGGEVTTERRGEAGERVDAVLRLDEIRSQASKLTHRVNDEVAALRAEKDRTDAERIDAALTAAWSVAESKGKVPDIVGPHMQWDEHERFKNNPEHYRALFVERINAEHAGRNHMQVLRQFEGLDKAVREVGNGILERAGQAADALTGAGLSIDSTSDEVLEKAEQTGDTGVLSARKIWRDSVARWADLQSTRRWLETVHGFGFDPRHPEQTGDFDPRNSLEREIQPLEPRKQRERRREQLAEVEHRIWRHQFGIARSVPSSVDSPAAALAWWNENGRPASGGHGAEDVEVSDDE